MSLIKDNVAIIPARGGSKRIPRKNIRNFCGKPMIAWSIEAAKASQCFSKILVSTDDYEIADISRQYGAEVPFMRPKELSDDHTGTAPVIAHAIDWLNNQGQTVQLACCIYATAPFIQAEDICSGLQLMRGGEWKYVLSATTFGYPIFRSFGKNEKGGVRMFFPEHLTCRSQDLPEAWHDAGQFCWGKSESWKFSVRVFDEWSTTVKLPRWRVQDIDTLEDWERAQILFSLINEGKTK
jgi:N-acylneuraminate cytidylyltransferase